MPRGVPKAGYRAPRVPGGRRQQSGLRVVSQETAATRNRGVAQGASVRADETPRQRFQRLAPKDVEAAKGAILYIQRFRDRRSYDLRQTDVEKIMGVLNAAVARLADVLENPDNPPAEITFED